MAAALTASRRKQLSEQLIEAAAAGFHRDVGRLLEERADVEAVDHKGYTPLSAAAVAGQTVVVGLLLRSLADPNHGAQDGRTPLHRATIHRWQPVMKLLLDNGAEPFAKDADGETPADMTKTVMLKELINNFPPEATKEARKERKKKLEDVPAVKIVEEPEPVKEPVFVPPPRISKEEEAKKAREEAAKKEADRKARFAATMDALAEEYGMTEDGESARPEPPSARCRVAGCRGEEARLNGKYIAVFATKEQLEFEKVGDSTCQITWNERFGEWRMLIGEFKLGSVLFRNKHKPNIKAEECLGMPKTGWQAWFGKGAEPVVELLPNRKHGDPEEEPDEIAEPEEAAEEAPSAPSPKAAAGPGGEYLEVHSDTRLRIVEQGGAKASEVGDMLAGCAGAAPEVRLHDGERIVETSDGLFAPGEVVQEVKDDGPEVAAKRWLDHFGAFAEVAPDVEAIQAAKAESQQLFAAGEVSFARMATSAALTAAKKLQATLLQSGEREPSPEEVDALVGVLHSNRSLLVMQQITSGDAEVLSFGTETAWSLVVQDANVALRADPANFKASFRRARGLLELGQLDEALVDANRVVEHYELYSSTSNPEAGILRERILEAIKKERRKWGERGQARWNRASAEVLIESVSEGPGEAARGEATSLPWEMVDKRQAASAAQQAAMRRLASAPKQTPSAPRIGGEIEKALLSTLKGDDARQLAYIKEHVSAAVLRKFWRRAPLGPDLLGLLVRRLADLAEEDTTLAAELLGAVGNAPSARTQAGMFDAEEQSALDKLLKKIGPAATAAAWPSEEEPGNKSAGSDFDF